MMREDEDLNSDTVNTAAGEEDQDRTISFEQIVSNHVDQHSQVSSIANNETGCVVEHMPSDTPVDKSALAAAIETVADVDHDAPTLAFSAVTADNSQQSSNAQQVEKQSHSAHTLFVSLLILLLLIVGAMGAGIWYFHDRVLPGVALGKVSLSGKQDHEIRSIVNHAIEQSNLDIADDQGHQLTAGLQQLFVNTDVDKTVNALINSKRDNQLTMLLPWVHRSVGLQSTIDSEQLDSFIIRTFVNSDDAAEPFKPVFDEKSDAFIVKEGSAGRSVDTLAVRESLKRLIAQPGRSIRVKLSSKRIAAPISRNTAHSLVEKLNNLLAKNIVLSNGDKTNFRLPHSVVASWIVIKPNFNNHTISYSVDRKSVYAWLRQELAEHLNQDLVNQEDAVNKAGQVIFTTMNGSNGVRIEYSDDIARQVCDALDKNVDANINVPSKITKYKVERVLVQMRIVVDKASQTAQIYRNDELIKTFPVCTGKNGNDESANGTFYIYLRHEVQDMRGFNDDGSRYFSPAVRWVSYYNGGEGFHTATWNYHGIATGDPEHYGSHGCINMYEQDARWLFEHCPRGTIVQVVGNQPQGPVRS